MKNITVLAIATVIGLLQTGCFSRAAAPDNGQPQVAQAAPLEAPATQPQTAAAPEPQVVAPAPAPQAIAPVALAPAPVAPAPQAPAPVAPAPQAPAAPTLQVNANSYFVSTNDGGPLNLRASNSTQAKVVGSLPQGTQVLMHVSDRSGEWFEVSASGGLRGWVAAAYLVDPNGYRAASSLPAPAAQRPMAQTSVVMPSTVAHGGPEYYSGLFVQTMDGGPLNLRVSPQLGAQVLQSLPHGSQVTYLDTVGQWTQVSTGNGTVGYVASDYLVYR